MNYVIAVYFRWHNFEDTDPAYEDYRKIPQKEEYNIPTYTYKHSKINTHKHSHII